MSDLGSQNLKSDHKSPDFVPVGDYLIYFRSLPSGKESFKLFCKTGHFSPHQPCSFYMVVCLIVVTKCMC